MCLPLGVEPGQTVQVTLRGHKLDAVTEIRCPTPQAAVKIVSQGTAEVPQKQDPGRVGDTQLVLEWTLPADLPPGELVFTIINPAGESPPHRLLIDVPGTIAAEVEPNDGFRQSQTLKIGRTLQGAIGQPQDVDVFAVRGQPGETLVVEALAARFGSAVDPILIAYDAGGRILAAVDDLPDSADARLEFALPADGAALVALQDAHDQGGPAHLYRIVAKRAQ
jgi:hypothetical protein